MQGRELLGKHHDRDRLTDEEVRDLGSRSATEDETPVLQLESQGKVFRFANRVDARVYVARSVEETGQGVTLACQRRA